MKFNNTIKLSQLLFKQNGRKEFTAKMTMMEGGSDNDDDDDDGTMHARLKPEQ